jgi:hypothetical protein
VSKAQEALPPQEQRNSSQALPQAYKPPLPPPASSALTSVKRSLVSSGKVPTCCGAFYLVG